MNLFELYLTPLDAKQFRVMVTQSLIASDGEADTTLPFWAEDEDWRTTIVKTLEATGWRSDVDLFPRPGEQDWMIAANILSANRDNFSPDYLARIGQALYESLFPMGKIREAFQVALRGAEVAGEALHLRLKFPAEAAKRSRLADYPWELLHDGQRFFHPAYQPKQKFRCCWYLHDPLMSRNCRIRNSRRCGMALRKLLLRG
jgi:hypothetical protein